MMKAAVVWGAAVFTAGAALAWVVGRKTAPVHTVYLTVPVADVRKGEPTGDVGFLGHLTERSVKPDTVWLSRPASDNTASRFCRAAAASSVASAPPAASPPAAPSGRSDTGAAQEQGQSAVAPPASPGGDQSPPVGGVTSDSAAILLLQAGRALGHRLDLWGATSDGRAWHGEYSLSHSFPRLEFRADSTGIGTKVTEARHFTLLGLTPHLGAAIGMAGLWDPVDGRLHFGPGASAGLALTWP